MQLLVYLGKIYRALENHQNVQVVYIDYETIFDHEDQQLLMRKLSDMAVRGRLLQLIRSCLSGRCYQVRVNNSLSKERKWYQKESAPVVTQASVLTCLQFLVYSNDLSTHCKSSESLICADDAKINNIDQPNNQFQKDLNRVATLSNLQSHSLNASKCSVADCSFSGSTLIFNEPEMSNLDVKDPPRPSYCRSTTKNLSLVINSNLKWNDHIEKNI